MHSEYVILFLIILSIVALGGFQAMVADLVHKTRFGDEEEEER